MLPYYIRMGATMCFLIVLTVALLEPRYSKRRTAWATCIFTAVVMAVNLAVMAAVGYEAFARVMPLTATAPYLALFFFLSKYRDWRAIFSMLTVISCGIAAMVLGAVVSNAFFHNSVLADLIARVACYVPICAFVLLVFREPYLAMLSILHRGWWVLCAFPITFFGAFYFLAVYPALLHDRPESLVPLVFLTAMLFCLYAVIVLFFRYVRETVGMREDKLLVVAQAAALRDQLDYIRQSMGQTEARRHDLSRGVDNAVLLLQDGKPDEALRLLADYQQAEARIENAPYCENETMNTLLTVYLNKAQQEGVRVVHQLYLPTVLPVDAAELSTVFANALGNAIRMCRDVPEGQRVLEITCLADMPKAQTAFEIACPYGGQFVLDADQRPIPPEGALGVGFRGIAAFVRRHDVLYNCEIKDNRFYLRIVINRRGAGL